MRIMGVAALLALSACARPAAAPRLSALSLPGTDGATHALGEVARGAQLGVIVFFGADCPVQRAHDGRLRDLFAAYRGRGVVVVAVDSEATGTLAGDREEARARGYPFPILSDPEGAAADALGATYATYTVVVDGTGKVRYHGGIDSDRAHLTPGAAPWLRAAIDRLLAGQDPDPAETTSFGCSLRRR